MKSAGVGPGDGSHEVGLGMSLRDDFNYLFGLVYDLDEFKFLSVDLALCQDFLAQPRQQATPVLTADQHDELATVARIDSLLGIVFLLGSGE